MLNQRSDLRLSQPEFGPCRFEPAGPLGAGWISAAVWGEFHQNCAINSRAVQSQRRWLLAHWFAGKPVMACTASPSIVDSCGPGKLISVSGARLLRYASADSADVRSMVIFFGVCLDGQCF